MPRFNYTAIIGSGERIEGVLTSGSRRDALKQILNKGHHPLHVEPVEGHHSVLRQAAEGALRRVSTADLAVFTRQFATLLKAGLPIVQALSTLRRQTSNRRLAEVILNIEEWLTRDAGELGDALDAYPRIFDPVYRGLVRAGERGGNLPTTLADLASHLTQSARLRKQVAGAFIYPLFLMILGTAAVFILVSFVIPKFQDLFDSLGQDLPLPTKLLIGVSDFMASWWWAVLAGLVAGLLALTAAFRRQGFRRWVDRLSLRLPVLGDMFLKLETTRVARTLGTLLASGVRMLEAITITGQAVRNVAIRETFPEIRQQVAAGEPLALAVERQEVFSPLTVNLIKTGEDTGELPDMLMELAQICDEESERAVSAAVKLLEPMLIIVMGGVVSAIIAAVLLPIFQAYSTLR